MADNWGRHIVNGTQQYNDKLLPDIASRVFRSPIAGPGAFGQES